MTAIDSRSRIEPHRHIAYFIAHWIQMIVMLLKVGNGFLAAAAFATLLVVFLSANASSLSCYVSTMNCAPNVTAFRMSDTVNGHAELQSNYNYRVCCNETSSVLGTSCSGNYTTILKLSALTNAHVEKNTYSNYSNSACLSVAAGGMGCQYSPDCSSLGPVYVCLASISADSNAHVGGCSAYSTKVCCAYIAHNLTFSLSPSTVWWGEPAVASGRLMSETSPLSGEAVYVNLSSTTKCTATTNSSGYYSCTLKTPGADGTYNYTAYTSQVSVTSMLTVAAHYGTKPIGTASRGVISMPVLMQERDGSVRAETVLVMVYRAR